MRCPSFLLEPARAVSLVPALDRPLPGARPACAKRRRSSCAGCARRHRDRAAPALSSSHARKALSGKFALRCWRQSMGGRGAGFFVLIGNVPWETIGLIVGAVVAAALVTIVFRMARERE